MVDEVVEAEMVPVVFRARRSAMTWLDGEAARLSSGPDGAFAVKVSRSDVIRAALRAWQRMPEGSRRL